MGAFESPIPRFYADAIAEARRRSIPVARKLLARVAPFRLAVDFLSGLASALVSSLLLRHVPYNVYPYFRNGRNFWITWAVSIGLLLLRQQPADYRERALRVRETETAVRVSVQALLLLVSAEFLFRLDVSVATLLLYFFITLCFLALERQMLLSLSEPLWMAYYGADRVVIYDETTPGTPTISSLVHPLPQPLSSAAVLDDVECFGCGVPAGAQASGPVLNHAAPITSAFLQSIQCTLLLVSAPHATADQRSQLIEIAGRAGAVTEFLPLAPRDTAVSPAERQDTGSLAAGRRGASWHYRVLKRGMDMSVSSLLVVLLSPLLIIIALLVRITSPGPALFVQERAGKNGDVFRMYKFRSMYANVPAYQVSPTHPSDRRITGLGRFLRRMSLDELPQLFNVLKGEMSLVGPRPEMPFLVDRYTPQQKQRLQALPGITGLWQLSGFRAYPIHENIAYDLYYLRNRSILMDAAILIHTAALGALGGI